VALMELSGHLGLSVIQTITKLITGLHRTDENS
jgi:hypothetical protein